VKILEVPLLVKSISSLQTASAQPFTQLSKAAVLSVEIEITCSSEENGSIGSGSTKKHFDIK
jgi:hypothetical protein